MNSFSENESIEAIYAVEDFLANAVVHEDDQKIAINGLKYNIKELSQQIAQQTSMNYNIIQTHVIIWLEMNYVPDNYSEIQMEEFESKVEQWVDSIEPQA